MSDDLEPILGHASEEVDKWEQFASGESFPVDRGDGDPDLHQRDSVAELWSVVAVGLACAAALFLLAALVGSFRWEGMSARDRLLFIATQGGSWPSGLLVLAAAGAELAGRGSQRRDLARWAVRCSAAVGVAVVVCAVYAIAYLALAHPSGSSADFGAVFVMSQVAEWSARVSGMLEVGASGLLAGLALFVLRRTTRATE